MRNLLIWLIVHRFGSSAGTGRLNDKLLNILKLCFSGHPHHGHHSHTSASHLGLNPGGSIGASATPVGGMIGGACIIVVEV